jgi:hypothetical protein
MRGLAKTCASGPFLIVGVNVLAVGAGVDADADIECIVGVSVQRCFFSPGCDCQSRGKHAMLRTGRSRIHREETRKQVCKNDKGL